MENCFLWLPDFKLIFLVLAIIAQVYVLKNTLLYKQIIVLIYILLRVITSLLP